MRALIDLNYKLYENKVELNSLHKTIEYIKDKVAEYFSKAYNYSKNELKKYLSRIPIYVARLPYILTDKIIGKVLGAYDLAKKEIKIDFSTLYNLPIFIKTLAEECAHALQHYIGKLKPKDPREYITNYFKDENEKEAKEVANKVLKSYMLERFGTYLVNRIKYATKVIPSLFFIKISNFFNNLIFYLLEDERNILQILKTLLNKINPTKNFSYG